MTIRSVKNPKREKGREKNPLSRICVLKRFVKPLKNSHKSKLRFTERITDARRVKSDGGCRSAEGGKKKSYAHFTELYLTLCSCAAESCSRRYSREEFQGRCRRVSLGLASRKDGQCTVEILCAKSGASGAHLNHVGGALKAIKTPGRPRTAGPAMREISVLDRDAPTCRHCFNNSTLRPPWLLHGWHIIVYLVTIDTARNGRPTGIVDRLVKSRRFRSIQSRTKDRRVSYEQASCWVPPRLLKAGT